MQRASATDAKEAVLRQREAALCIWVGRSTTPKKFTNGLRFSGFLDPAHDAAINDHQTFLCSSDFCPHAKRILRLKIDFGKPCLTVSVYTGNLFFFWLICLVSRHLSPVCTALPPKGAMDKWQTEPK